MCECKVCGLSKTRTKVGTYKAGGSVFVDEQDRAWNGRTCPPCQHAQISARRAQSPRRHYRKRLKEESRPLDPREFGPDAPLFSPKMRTCRDCSSPTPNYYYCGPCHYIKTANNPDLYAGLDESTVDLGSKSGAFAKGAGFRY